MTFKILPIGGLGQIGSNMMQIQTAASSFIIDCGILFPYEDTFDINYLIPNFEFLERPEAICITHGHEDHIGALAHLVEKFPGLKIFAPKFAAVLISKKFEFYPRKLKYELSTDIDHPLSFDNIEVDYVRVNHSIPDTFGLFLKNTQTKTGVFYISDFKVDKHNKHEPYFDFKKLKTLSKGCDRKVLMADSTNITSRQSKTTSEGELIPAFEEYLNSDHQRVFITTFSSNVHRIKNFYELSIKAGRKPVLYGRSMKNYWESAFDAGIVDDPDCFHDVSSIDNESDKLCVIVSGCQGDFRSTFRRICYGQDSWFKPNENDLFLMSSKAIPGNEKKISLCLNELSKFQTKIITSSDSLIHASGHACKDDLKTVIDEYQPNVYVPIHGEGFFLERHQEWVKSVLPLAKSFKVQNFELFDFENLSQEGVEQHDPIIIQGKAFELTRDSVRERRKIAEAGLVNINIVLNAKKVVTQDIKTHGINFPKEHSFEKFEKIIERIVQKHAKKSHSEEIRIQSRKLFVDLLGIKPVVSVSIYSL